MSRRPTPTPLAPGRSCACAFAFTLALAAGLAGCGSGASSGPWLTMPDATTHAARFPMGLDSSHAICSCNECHQACTTAADGTVTGCVVAESFKSYTCTGCHYSTAQYPGLHHNDRTAIDARHAAVTGYQYLDSACLRCHPQGIAVDHSVRFPLPHGATAGTVAALCGDCHTSPTDRKVLGCAACHPHDLAATATAHAKVPGFKATDSMLCVRCHGDGTVTRVSAHTTFPIAAGGHSGPTGGACLSCHPALRATPKAFAADFTLTTCTGCHVAVSVTASGTTFHDDQAALATLHGSVTDFGSTVTRLGLSAACRSCHPDGAGGAPSNHPQLFPIGSGTKHAGIGCVACHGPATDLASRRNTANLLCAGCHAGIAGFSTKHSAGAILVTTGTNCATTGYAATSPLCLKCHADSQVDRVASHPGGRTGFGVGRHAAAGCLTCHVQRRTDKPFDAVNWSQPNPASQGTAGCATCHNHGCGGD